jgi:hypothetical protein
MRLPSSTTSTPSTGDHTSATSDPVVEVATVTGSAPTGDSSAPAASKHPPVDSPNVCFSSWFHSGNCINHVTPGLNRDRHPPPLSTLDNSPRDPMLGGTFRAGDREQFRKIISPRVGDREQYARDRQLSRFDITGLATKAYHGDLDGVDELTIPFLHECGYNSFAPEAPEDFLLCYRDIQLVHRKVLTGWENTCSGRSSPPVKYIVEEAVPHFPKLTSLDAHQKQHHVPYSLDFSINGTFCQYMGLPVRYGPSSMYF